MLRNFVLIFLLNFVLLNIILAQIGFEAGFSYNNIWDAELVKNKFGLYGYRIGMDYEAKFQKKNSRALRAGLFFNQKGYKQKFDSNFTFRLTYVSIPFNYVFHIDKKIIVLIGSEFNWLAQIRSNVENVRFKKFDLNIALGLNYKIWNKYYCFIQGNLGLLPLVDYFEFDKLGNIIKDTHDIRLWNLVMGVRTNFD